MPLWLIYKNTIKEGENMFYPLREGSFVKLNMETVKRGNTKRNAWMDAHADEVFTIQYDPKWGANPTIYYLREDESDPKWYFLRSELILSKKK